MRRPKGVKDESQSQREDETEKYAKEMQLQNFNRVSKTASVAAAWNPNHSNEKECISKNE